MKKAILKIAIIIVLLLNIISLCSCSTKKYVYVPMTKEYIKKHQAGADSFDRLMLKKVEKTNVKN